MRTHRPISGGGGGRRSGVPRADGRAIVDDGGAWYPLGLTFMWSDQGIKYHPDHYRQNLEWAAAHGIDFKRPLEEVNWSGELRIDQTRPEWADWRDIFARDLDQSYDLGLRNGITLSGKGTAVDREWLAREAGAVIADGRAHKVLIVEMQNEYSNGGDPLGVLVGMARTIGARIPNLLAYSTPGNAAEADEIKRTAAANGIRVMIRHTERNPADYGWRDVRQPWDFHEDHGLVGADWEGPGPGSSGSTNTNPLQLAMKRALAAACGAPIFVLHTGTGVYGDGQPSSSGVPRPANFWEIENIEAIVSAVRGIVALLPDGLPNWQAANTGWVPPNPVAPFQPDQYWEGDHGRGVNKAYAALAPDGRIFQAPCGVRDFVRLSASYPLRDVTIYDPITLRPFDGIEGRTFAQGEAIELPGGGLEANFAYIIHGRR